MLFSPKLTHVLLALFYKFWYLFKLIVKNWQAKALNESIGPSSLDKKSEEIPPVTMFSNLMRVALLACISILLYIISLVVYNIFFHPLRNIPGPFPAKITRLWLFFQDYSGNPHNYIRELHARLGKLKDERRRARKD